MYIHMCIYIYIYIYEYRPPVAAARQPHAAGRGGLRRRARRERARPRLGGGIRPRDGDAGARPCRHGRRPQRGHRRLPQERQARARPGAAAVQAAAAPGARVTRAACARPASPPNTHLNIILLGPSLVRKHLGVLNVEQTYFKLTGEKTL